ncbi:metal-sulfur cluster assembly factor [Streptomyces sp. NPDC004629]|uniref:metal-sulfur cluster assembly factor n=1 Tax=Streptomyces sp. NPDC004629 TaxID=3364705 RepID=UPI0036CD3A02
MSVTTEQVQDVLNTIIDPCSINAGAPAGLVDMGLVRDVRVDDDPEGGCHVSVAVGVTEPTCVLLGSFANETRERLSALDGVSSVDVKVLGDLQWSEDDLSPRYRERLERHRQERRSKLMLTITPAGAR